MTAQTLLHIMALYCLRRLQQSFLVRQHWNTVTMCLQRQEVYRCLNLLLFYRLMGSLGLNNGYNEN